MQPGITGSRITAPLSLLLSFTALFLPAVICHGANIYVDDNTCPYTGSGSSSNPYCSITTAINSASSGDTVLVHPGNYAERIIMKTGVNVQNAQSTRPVILPSTKTLAAFEGVDNCTLDGFILDASSGGGGGGMGGGGGGGGMGSSVAIIRIYDSSQNVTISNCELKGAAVPGDSSFRSGIRLNGQVTVNILNNTIYNTDYGGITTRSSDYIRNSTLTIQGNVIEGNGTAGIFLYGQSGYSNRVIIGGSTINDGNLIYNNGTSSTQNGSGIFLKRIDQVSIENNTVQANRRAGILLMDTSSVSPHITGNSIYDNGQAGINIGGASALTIGGNNEIYGNGTSGVSFFVSRNADLSGTASSQPVSIFGNSIYGNTKSGIAVLDRITGTLSIDSNTIYQNTTSGIAFFIACNAIITDNDIHTHTGAAGIFTGDWSGTATPDRDTLPSTVYFNRAYGPVNLTVKRNKIHDNRAGMRLDHASGTISNNLVYNNSKAGIRFSGNSVSPYEPFGAAWGITVLSNNTLVDNGTVTDILDGSGGYLYTERLGSGMVYDDINNTLNRDFFAPPVKDQNQGTRVIQNNIAAFNAAAGIKDAACTAERDYNLYYGNFGYDTFAPAILGGCYTGWPPSGGNPNETFTEDPLFVDRLNFDYQLLPGSAAVSGGSDGLDLGAYGGSDPITW